MRCRYYSRCLLADATSVTCMRDGNEHCGQWRRFEKERKKQ